MEEVKQDLIKNLQQEGYSDVSMATSSQNYEDDPEADAQDPYADEADMSEEMIRKAEESVLQTKRAIMAHTQSSDSNKAKEG